MRQDISSFDKVDICSWLMVV